VEGDVDGTSWYESIIPLLKANGLAPMELGTFPPGTGDFSALIQRWKAEKAEILWGNLMPDSFAILWRQCAQQGYRPKMALIGRALLDISSVEALGGNLGDGILTEAWWLPDYPYGSPPYPGSKAFAEMYEKERGLPWVMPLGAAYSQIQVIVDAVSKAGTLDVDRVNEVMPQTDVVTSLGKVHFDPKTHTCAAPVVIAQWRKTEKGWALPIVFSSIPEIKPTAEILFPLPPW
jgi:branched-chain amino acid transport system substrate-binding protein